MNRMSSLYMNPQIAGNTPWSTSVMAEPDPYDTAAYEAAEGAGYITAIAGRGGSMDVFANASTLDATTAGLSAAAITLLAAGGLTALNMRYGGNDGILGNWQLPPRGVTIQEIPPAYNWQQHLIQGLRDNL